MAKPTPISPEEDLDSRVDALLKDLDVTSQSAEKTLRTDPIEAAAPASTSGAAGSAGAAISALDDLDKQIQELLALDPDVAPPAGSAGPAAAPAAPATSVSASVVPPPHQSRRPEPRAADDAPLADDIGSLDADLARLTDSLLTTNSPLPNPEPVRPAPAASAKGSPAVSDEPDVLSAPTVAHLDGAASAGSKHAATETPDAPVLSRGLAGSIGPGVAKFGSSVGRAAGPAVLSVMSVASSPLNSRPKIVRDTVGWIALWTAFLSLSLWTYLLLFHKPEIPHTENAPIQIVDSENRVRDKHAPAAASSESAHADEPAKTGH